MSKQDRSNGDFGYITVGSIAQAYQDDLIKTYIVLALIRDGEEQYETMTRESRSYPELPKAVDVIREMIWDTSRAMGLTQAEMTVAVATAHDAVVDELLVIGRSFASEQEAEDAAHAFNEAEFRRRKKEETS